MVKSHFPAANSCLFATKNGKGSKMTIWWRLHQLGLCSLIATLLLAPTALLAAHEQSPTAASSLTQACLGRVPLGLTFDDGPSPLYTPRILSILARHNAHATFFVVGGNALRFPSQLRAEIAAGDTIGNHTFDHPRLPHLSRSAQDKEVSATTAAIIAAVPGVQVTLFRPPYGLLDHAQRERLLASGLSVVLWNEDSVDWRDPSPERLSQQVEAAARPGGLLLMHDIHPVTVAALDGILSNLGKRGFCFVTVGELERYRVASGMVVQHQAKGLPLIDSAQ